MDPELGFDILVTGTLRTFRDQQHVAYEAARYLKSRHPNELIEILDRSNGQKVVMLADGKRAGSANLHRTISGVSA
jgi:hypothetical protein